MIASNVVLLPVMDHAINKILKKIYISNNAYGITQLQQNPDLSNISHSSALKCARGVSQYTQRVRHATLEGGGEVVGGGEEGDSVVAQ
jgi:hypothetical protein